MSDGKKPREHSGIMYKEDGTHEHIRMVHGEGEPCEPSGYKNPDHFDSWTGDDGIKRMRRIAGSASVGATKEYSAKYDDIDWGN